MIDHVSRCPDRCVVAILADIGGLYVRRSFACCCCSVVTTGAITHNTGVIEICWTPGNGCVAIFADIVARDMGRVLTNCRNAVVA